MYFLILLYVSIPLLFSHFFARLGSGFIIDNGIGYFESVKMHAFFILLVLATGEMLIFSLKDFVTRISKQTWILLFGGSMILVLGQIFFTSYPSFRDLWYGVGEKQHGLIMMLGCLWLGILTYIAGKAVQKKIFGGILFAGCFVSIIAIIEYFGYNIFLGQIYQNTGSWGAIRSTSTLGNPNYVAGFLLMLLPFTLLMQGKILRYSTLALFICGILTTQSFIGISLMILSLLVLGSYRLPKKYFYLILGIGVVLGSIGLGLLKNTDKWLSLESRFVLMESVASRVITGMPQSIIGYGPDAIRNLFQESRSPEVGAYFPENMIIDSSHNIFLDILASYGFIGVCLLSILIFLRWKHLEWWSKVSLILGVLFLSLNVFVISHLLIFVYLLSYIGENRVK